MSGLTIPHFTTVEQVKSSVSIYDGGKLHISTPSGTQYLYGGILTSYYLPHEYMVPGEPTAQHPDRDNLMRLSVGAQWVRTFDPETGQWGEEVRLGHLSAYEENVPLANFELSMDTFTAVFTTQAGEEGCFYRKRDLFQQT
jgi:hypothetical protein